MRISHLTEAKEVDEIKKEEMKKKKKGRDGEGSIWKTQL